MCQVERSGQLTSIFECLTEGPNSRRGHVIRSESTLYAFRGRENLSALSQDRQRFLSPLRAGHLASILPQLIPLMAGDPSVGICRN